MAKLVIKPVLREAAFIALAGATLAFAANALSPRGVDLRRVYVAEKSPLQSPLGSPETAGATNNPPRTAEEETVAHLKEKGLQTMDTQQVRTLFQDSRYREGAVIFIDVRGDDHYAEGHIPGSHHFDFNYHLDQVSQVIRACQSAQQIIVYCNGGKCDTSESAALFLRDSIRIPADKLFVYTGGIADWGDKGFPIEVGGQNSGNLRDSANAPR